VKMSIQRVALGDLEANPYRHIEQYRIDPEKIDALIASYRESGFWDGSIQVRPHPGKDGKYQLAFGHHRVAAAKQERLGEIGVVVADRDNATMLRMMASENAEEFKHSPLVTQETIGAVIEAYGAGEIELEPVDPKTPKHTIYVAPGGATYTCQTIARFLGWTKRHGDDKDEPTRACRIAFDAWHATHTLGIDVQKVQQQLAAGGDDLLTTKATKAVLSAAKTAKRTAEKAGAAPAVAKAAAQQAAKDAVAQIKEEGEAHTTRDRAGRVGHKAAQKALGKAGMRVDPEEPPPLPTFVAQTSDRIRQRTLTFMADIQERVDAILPYRDQLPESIREGLMKELRRSAEEIADTMIRRADALRAAPHEECHPVPQEAECMTTEARDKEAVKAFATVIDL